METKKTREALFNEINFLSIRVKMLNGIVQNEGFVHSEELEEWNDIMFDTIQELRNIRDKINQLFLH